MYQVPVLIQQLQVARTPEHFMHTDATITLERKDPYRGSMRTRPAATTTSQKALPSLDRAGPCAGCSITIAAVNYTGVFGL